LPAETVSLYIMNESRAWAPLDIAYLITADTMWSGRPLQVRDVGPNWEDGNQDPHWVDRLQFLIQCHGGSTAAYPAYLSREEFPPESILLPAGSGLDEARLNARFSRKYRSIEWNGWTLLLLADR
jgi:hypothetical protein